MSMPYAAQRYAATRPWAKRAGQIFSQTLKLEDASAGLAEAVRRELERAAQVFAVSEETCRNEGLLALAYGCFVRGGRVIAHLDGALAEALAATRLPTQLPDTLRLPAEACFLHVEGLGGAFLYHDSRDAALDLVLVGAALGDDSTAWLEEAEPMIALRVGYPGELAPQLAEVPEAWQPLLNAVIGALSVLTQPKAELAREWEASAPAELVAAAASGATPKARQKARSALLTQGYVEVTHCRYPELAAGVTYGTQGYWRRQQFGEDKANSRLVWVQPR